MQDRFKFRLWHKPLKIMHYNDFTVTATGYMAKIYQQDDYMMKFNQEDLEFDKQCILMQCTGLKDKNGKLIYEGDIVKSDFDFITNTINPLRFNIGNVIYSDYIAGFVIASDINDYSPYKTSFFGKTEALNCVVIGNIYENTELLED